jgi:plastocyanin
MRSRREFLQLGGVAIATLSLRSVACASNYVEIRMQGREDGSHVWFEPVGVHIQPGQSIRWTNFDSANVHTVTSYHPDKFNRPLRIPETAAPWDSDYLLPNGFFVLQLTEAGVYDYYCRPHEHAGMVGRIVVGTPARGSWGNLPVGEGDKALPRLALDGFPSVEEILQKGVVQRVQTRSGSA